MSITTYDIVLFGATSFVGQIVARYLLDHQNTYSDDGFSFAIAGRSEAKLSRLKDKLNAAHLPTIIADADDSLSLKHMVACAKVVVSTVGPYDLYGDKLIKACVVAGVDYCDLTGEIHWVKRMIDTHVTTTRKTGARIVNCCGFDSIPSDLGVYFLQQKALEKYGVPCTQIDMRVKAAKGGLSGGTLASMSNVIAKATKDSKLRKSLKDPYTICPSNLFSLGVLSKTKQPSMEKPEFEEVHNRWRAPFIMAMINTKVVHRTNALLEGKYGANLTYSEAVWVGKGLKGRAMAYGVTAGIAGLTAGLSMPVSRKILTERILPKTGEGPSKKAQENGFFNLQFFGKTDSGQVLNVQVTGDKDPGYGATAQMLSQAALCLLKDVPKNASGGFYTPAALLGDALIKRLESYTGVAFKVVS